MSSREAESWITRWSGSRSADLFGSGTEALAAALIDAKGRHATDTPEAIIPAYCCPDLISACVFAGVRAVPVDINAGAWGYDLESLELAIGAHTVAVLAVDFCGIGDQAQALFDIVRRRGPLLIQDSAQFMPALAAPVWSGDYVVLSFGRGKPLNLLGGGALLFDPSRRTQIAALGRELGKSVQIKDALRRSWFAALAFNTATDPHLYAFTSLLPGLGVGQTRYCRLDSIERGSDRLRSRFAAAMLSYTSDSGYTTRHWMPFLDAWRERGLTVLSVADISTRDSGPLLRLPMLAPDKEIRDRILLELSEAGLGASAFYAASIDRIAGVPSYVLAGGPYRNAANLADRLLTLPTYSRFEARAAQRTDHIVRRLLGR